MREIGRLVGIYHRRVGTALARDHAAGETILDVLEVGHFPESGGTVDLEGALLDFVSWSEDASTITLPAGLAAAWEEGSRVWTTPPSLDVIASVVVEDEGEAIECVVPHELRDMFIEGVRDPVNAESVEIEQTEDGWALAAAVQEQPDTDGSYTRPETLPIAEAMQVADLSAVNIDGVSITGGSIAIARGQSGSLAETWASLDNPSLTLGAPPANWSTASPITTSPANPGVRFISTRMSGELEALVRGQHRPIAAGGSPVFKYVRPNDPGLPANFQDGTVTFDYRWSGQKSNTLLRGEQSGIWFRGLPTDIEYALAIGHTGRRAQFLDVADGEVAFYAGSTRLNGGPVFSGIPAGVWQTVEFTVRGAAIKVQIKDKGATSWRASWSGTTTTIPAAGSVAIVHRTGPWFNGEATTLTQDVEFDNLTITALQTGFQVDADGRTRAEHLTVGQSATVPDPLLPSDAVNKGYVDVVPTPTAATDRANKGYVDAGRGFAHHTANGTIAPTTNTETRLRFPTVVAAGGWSYNDSSSPLRRDFTCTSAGVYTVSFSWLWAGNATGIRTGRITINGTLQPERTSQVPGHAASLGQQVLITRRFAAGDVIYLEVRQTSGNDLVVDPTATAIFVKQGV